MAKCEGVTHYIKATAEIYFPDGHVCCALCPMLETYARNQCRRSGEYLLDTRITGFYCPLKFENTEEQKNETV